MNPAHRLPTADLQAALPRLRRYARVLVGGPEGADDLVARTLAGAWRATREPRREMLPWLFGLMHAAHCTTLRATRFGARSRSGRPFALTGGAPSVVPVGAGDDLCARLMRLPAAERETLMLAAVERLSYADIARVLDVPVAAVMATLARARERLRSMEGTASPRA